MKRITVWILTLLASIAAAGCWVNPRPQNSASNDVREYYIKLATPNMQYRYTVTADAKYTPKSGDLIMDMQGPSKDTFGTMQVFTCNWTYPTFSGPTIWFYAV